MEIGARPVSDAAAPAEIAPESGDAVQTSLKRRDWVLFVKQGAYGACMFAEEGFFSVPAYPLETVVDPTGAGDAFAGGLCGYLDSLDVEKFTDAQLRCAAVYGSVLASFVVEDFGSERLQRLSEREIANRFQEFRQMTVFETPPVLAELKS